MIYKNILIAFGLIGLGLLLYKLLIGLLLPIIMFVALGYVLRYLLQSPELEFDSEASKILRKGTSSESNKNIVEIKPILKEKSFEGENTFE